jgi:hypothetical protein
MHGHARDQGYAEVRLHVVLFPAPRKFTDGVAGAQIPILELLPLLEKDIEAYAEEAAVEGIAGRPFSQLRSALAEVSVDKLAEAVARHSELRWRAKVRLAQRRIELSGWEVACHQAALEVLGYRPNRDPMLAVAEAFPIGVWRTAAAGLADAAWSAQAENWRQAGVRPANLPRRRLAQYARWVAARPDWPERLLGLGATLKAGMTATTRRTALRELIMNAVCAGELSGTRFDTWWCDAALPLLAATLGPSGHEQAEGCTEFQSCWRGWIIGDAPAELVRLAREFGVGSERKTGGGVLRQGDLQGLLGWLATLAK